MRPRYIALAVPVAILVLAGCAETQPSRFYLLASPPAAETRPDATRPVAVGLGPVSLPAYLDRPQIVRRDSAYTLEVSEFHRWGEPLDVMVPRVLAETLAVRLDSNQVFVTPSRHEQPVDYNVDIDMFRFDADADGTAVLSARWRVRDARDRPVAMKTTTIREPVEGGYEGTVAALSRALVGLGEAIAPALHPPARSPAR